MLPVLNIGPSALQTPGLVLLVGIWLGLSLAEKFWAKRGIQPKLLYNLAFIALTAGVVGARLAGVKSNVSSVVAVHKKRPSLSPLSARF